jgi:dihydroorotate dehydrogenase electron transfer subunit
MKKMLNLVVTENNQLNKNYCLLKLTTSDNIRLSDIQAGQFVAIKGKRANSLFVNKHFT